MSETLSFPGLGLEFQLNPVAFTVAGWPIRWYGILVALAFLLGAMYVLHRVRAFGLDADRVMDVILGGALLGIVGARLYYVIFSGDWDTYKMDPTSIFRVWEGGIAVYGGIIGAVAAAVIVGRWRRVKLFPLLDLGSGGLLLGQAIGRWGNFVNIEAFGSNTTSPLGMTSSSIANYLRANRQQLQAIGVEIDPAMPVHPTFLYESIWCLIGFLFLAYYTKRRRFDGELSLLYLGWYGLGRFFIEGLRTDSLMIGTLRVSRLLALLCVLFAAVTLVIIRSRIRREGDPSYLKLYVDTEEGQAILAGEFYPKRGAAKPDKDAPPEASDEQESAPDEPDGDADDITDKEQKDS